ncbi:MAG: AAA domain-containing protein [Actinobacteria bacterium]|nr:AAA domain-containing protein [Actinomycetota bacterium]
MTDFNHFKSAFESIVGNVEKTIQGKEEIVRLALVSLLAEGHVLLEDVPGVGKTMLAKSLAKSLGCSWSRIQFTPDLLPSDVTGVNVWNQQVGDFRFKAGAVFANICLADEVNRASPKTQAALLESMEERQVTVDGVTHRLDEPFMVIATQNPVEHEGTYPLPESQLDRFMMRLSMGYPSRAAELEILDTHGERFPLEELQAVAEAESVISLIKMAREVHVAQSLKRYIVDLTEATREHPSVHLGASPRASLYLLKASRAQAASRGRDYVVPDDIKDLVVPVLSHRILLSAETQLHGSTSQDFLDALMDRVPVPAREQA